MVDKDEKIICSCLYYKRKRIHSVLRDRAIRSYEDFAKITSVGLICGSCKDRCKDIVEEFLNESKEQ